MLKTILILTLISCISLTQAQNIDRISNLDNMDFTSLYFLSATNSFVVDYLEINPDEPLPYDALYKFSDINKSDFLFKLDSLLKDLPEENAKGIIDSILIWERMSGILDFPYMLEGTGLSEYLEIIANIDSTSKLIDRYIKIEGQYWGSLASSQSTEVYYDLMNYLLHLDGINRLDFFRKYFDKAYEFGKNN